VDRCDECGFVYGSIAPSSIPAALREGAQAFVGVLAGRLRAHPIAGMWSALEYACHLRDMIDVQRARIDLALREDVPYFTPMGREERVTRDAYNQQDPELVRAQVVVSAYELADVFELLDDAQRARRGVYTWPVEAERDLTWVCVHTVHEVVHHRMDVVRVLTAAGTPPAAG
jgi:DNA segregation ATPase FtsK/SpoIIIE, S-DNA-T family